MGVHPRRRENERRPIEAAAPGHGVSYASTDRSAVRFWKTRVSRHEYRENLRTRHARHSCCRDFGARFASTTSAYDTWAYDLVRPLVVLVGFRKNPSARRDARTTTNVLRQRIPVSPFPRGRLGDLTRATPRAATGRQQGEARNGHTREIALIVNAVLPCSQRVASRVIFSESMRSGRATSISDHRLTDPGHSLVRYDIENLVTNISSKPLGNH